METHYDFIFDLDMFPRPPDGWLRRRSGVLPAAVNAVVCHAGVRVLGDGGYVGWLVPAPELGRLDHPVALASGHDNGVTLIGADTRSGLEFMLSWALRRWRERPALEPPAGRDPDMWRAQNQYLIDARAEDR